MGLRSKYLKLRFHTVEDLIKAKRYILYIIYCTLTALLWVITVKRYHNIYILVVSYFRDIMPAVKRNREREKSRSTYDPSLFTG